MQTVKITFIQKALVIALLTLTTSVYAQNVAINNTGASANSYAVLDIDDTANNKGVLMPRITSAERAAISGLGASEEGLTVYDTSTDSYWFWDGTQWLEMEGSISGWSSAGNAGTSPGTDFIGTIDAQDLIFKTDNAERVRVEATGEIGIGESSPLDALHLTKDQDATTSLRLDNTNQGTDVISTSLSFYDGSNQEALVGFNNYTDELIITNDGLGTSNSHIIIDSDEDIRFRTEGSTAMTIENISNNVGIGTTTPDTTFHVVGNIKIEDGNEGTGKVLTSDANGVATWQDFTTASTSAIYLQLSDTTTQRPTHANPWPVVFSTNDGGNGISHTAGDSTITIQHSGVYNMVAQPQVNRNGSAGTAKFHCWYQLNQGSGWTDVPNSNILLDMPNPNQDDVIIISLTTYLDAGDQVRVMISTSDPAKHVKLLPQLGIPDEPNIPSIIFTMFKL